MMSVGKLHYKKRQVFLWQLYARVYDEVMLQFLPYRQLIIDVTQALNPRENWYVLDAGCGTGNFLYHLRQSFPRIKALGIDYSPAMLNRARLKVKKMPLKGQELFFQEVNLNEGLPFKDEEFDGVICVNVLYAVNDPVFLLEEICRVLKNSGRMILVTPPFQPQMGPVFKEHLSRLKEAAPSGWLWKLACQIVRLFPFLIIFLLINNFIKSRQSFHFLKEEELSIIVKKCGFKVVSIRPVYGGQDWLLEAQKIASIPA